METKDSRIPATDEPERAKFDLLQGAVVIDDIGLRFWAAPGVRNLFLGVGRCFDFTCGVGGADRIFLRGASADHRVTVSGDELTLRHLALNTEVRLHAARGPRELVFDDGAVALGAVWRGARQTAALLNVVGELKAGVTATVATHIRPVPCRGVHAAPEWALIQVEGLCGLETVYATAGFKSDLEVPRLHLEGRLSEHAATLQGMVLSLTRRANGLLDGVYVIGKASLVFEDGVVDAATLGCAVRLNHAWPTPSGPAVRAMPRITAVALEVDAGEIAWFPPLEAGGLPSGLFACCRAGQVFEACVSLDQPVEVYGFPRLHLRVGGQHRAAHFTSGSGTSTLRFVYTVCEDDVVHAAGSETRGLTIAGAGNLDVELGPVLTSGAAIQPLLPVPYACGDNSVPLAVEMPDESTWQSLISESERQVAKVLALLDERQEGAGERLVITERSMRQVRPDVEIDLLPDIDLRDFETVAEAA